MSSPTSTSCPSSSTSSSPLPAIKDPLSGYIKVIPEEVETLIKDIFSTLSQVNLIKGEIEPIYMGLFRCSKICQEIAETNIEKFTSWYAEIGSKEETLCIRYARTLEKVLETIDNFSSLKADCDVPSRSFLNTLNHNIEKKEERRVTSYLQKYSDYQRILDAQKDFLISRCQKAAVAIDYLIGVSKEKQIKINNVLFPSVPIWIRQSAITPCILTANAFSTAASSNFVAGGKLKEKPEEEAKEMEKPPQEKPPLEESPCKVSRKQLIGLIGKFNTLIGFVDVNLQAYRASCRGAIYDPLQQLSKIDKIIKVIKANFGECGTDATNVVLGYHRALKELKSELDNSTVLEAGAAIFEVTAEALITRCDRAAKAINKFIMLRDTLMPYRTRLAPLPILFTAALFDSLKKNVDATE